MKAKIYVYEILNLILDFPHLDLWQVWSKLILPHYKYAQQIIWPGLFFKVYDTGFVFIFWLFEWKVCLMYNSQDSNIYIVIFQNYICPLSMLSHDQKFFDKAALCHLYDHIVSEFLLVCNIYEWQEMKCYIGE